MSSAAGDRHVIEAEIVEVPVVHQLSEGIKSGHYGYLVHTGEVCISCQSREAVVLPGELAWIGGGQPRQLLARGPASWTVFRVRNRAFSPALEADRIAWELLMRLGSVGPKIALTGGTIEAVDRLAESMCAWHDCDNPVALPALKGALFQILVLIAEDHLFKKATHHVTASGPRWGELQRVLLLIDQEAVTIRDAKALAGRCGMSRSALYRLFQEEGLPTPARMLEQARLEASTRLMRDSNRTVLEIAMETGHHSLSAFYRSFVRAFGQSPGKWRRSKHADNKREGNHR